MLTDKVLIQNCIRHDRNAQKILFEKFSGKMMTVCLRYINNKDDASVILNTAFMKVFKNITQFKTEGTLEGWIKKIVINCAIDFIRADKSYNRQIQLVADDYPDKEAAALDEGDVDYMNTVSIEELLQFINELSPVTKSVFNLFAIDEFTHRQIGEQLGISEGTSRWHLSEARKKLQQGIRQRINRYNTYGY
ncbi:MAG TPA: RNA polymerase sigma factor [Chitinophagales bacterium]|nr:RNA polymerase sigma factor [Chitinophagales bacterium]